MANNWTKPQEKAIETKGNILVSAAAGSGKTAVLVERVIRKITDKNGISADKLLIVTFTNAAAAEMQSRIAKRLDDECIAHPEDLHLLEQKRLLASAKICTIDSFCIDLVRENFEKLGIAPDFKIGEKGNLKAIDERVISQIINRNLEEDNCDFALLLDIVGSEYDETDFKELIFKLFDYSRQLPFPEIWYDSLLEQYKDGSFSKDGEWYNYIFSEACDILDEAINMTANMFDLSLAEPRCADKWQAHIKRVAECVEELEKAANTRDWDEFYKALCEFHIEPLPTVQKVGHLADIVCVKENYNYIRTALPEKLFKYFYADYATINAQFSELQRPVIKLVEILKEFEQKVYEEYKASNTFTFHNTEHMALGLLCEMQNGAIIIKDQAKALMADYEEVMVDEYQDTNDLQELLFKVLSNNEKNLFVVGDIKQSIYGFRGANPKNFASKKNRYISIDESKEDDPKKIILGNNFRCKDKVCDFINFFFERFMTAETGNIAYTEDEALVPSAEYPACEHPAVEAHIINCKSAEDKVAVCEARYIGEYILKAMKQENAIRVDKNTLRKPRFSDFTVLMRSPKNKAPVMVEEFRRMGIPVSYNPESFAESMEIAVMLNLLSVIDNPNNDIALMSVIMSPIFRFTANEIATVKAMRKKGSLYASVIFASQNGNTKAEKLLKTLERFRAYSVTNSLSRLIFALVTETGYFDTVSLMSDGTKRRGNLLLLCDYADKYTETGASSIGGFVRHILKQSETGLASAAAESGDMVKIMSIHASKGLQFPICILADTASRISDNEAKSATVYSTEMGIGFKYFDETEKEKKTTIGREVILDKLHNDRICEELRLLYVALTRTQDRLVITSALSNRDNKLTAIRNVLISNGGKIGKGVLRRTASYSDWLIAALMLHPKGERLRDGAPIIAEDTASEVEIILNGTFDEAEIEEPHVTEPKADEILVKSIEQNLAYKYPFERVAQIEAKASVSVLANKAESRKFQFTAKPAFMSNGGITAAQRGTAMHRVMELFDFNKFDCIDQELERLYEHQYISEREYESVDKDKLKAFFESDIFERIMKAQRVERELRFLTEMPASRVAPDLEGDDALENIIVQGAVDLCFVENDGIVILDFKTDRAEKEETLKEAYSEQLNIYGIACEKIFEKPVKQKIIYSFALSKEIEL